MGLGIVVCVVLEGWSCSSWHIVEVIFGLFRT